MASTDARPIPIKNTAYRVTFPILDNTGALVTAAASATVKVSKDGGTFANATSATPTEIATSSGMYFADLTATEMNADCVAIIVTTTTTNAKTTPIVLYPQETGDIKVDQQSIAGDATATNNVAKTTRAIGRGTVGSSPTLTSITTSAFAPSGAVADQFKGRIITFDADTTTAGLRGQATDITANTSSATPTFTVTSLVGSIQAGDTFSVT